MKTNKDDLGNRMKGYENCTRNFLPRRSYTIIRIDGKAFHSYTRGCKRPFDMDLIEDMDLTAKYLCKNIQGAVCAFVQSDEISIVITDFKDIKTSAWFDNNIQKMCSVSASMATSMFNEARIRRQMELQFKMDICEQTKLNILGWIKHYKKAEFDSRVFQIPSKTEVMNYMVWRQQDTTRNSIQSVAHYLYSDKNLENKNCNQMKEMMWTEKGVNWNEFDDKLKYGRMIIKEKELNETPYINADKVQTNYIRTKWVSVAPPIFTQDKEYLYNLIPDISI